LLHGGFLLFNPANLGHTRPQVQKRRQLPQLIGSAGGVDLNPAIIFVTDPAVHPDLAGVLLNEEAKSNTLHTPRDKPAARLGCRCFQLGGSPRRAVLESLIAWSIACRKLFTVKGLEIR
jgi:hypothetical protein